MLIRDHAGQIVPAGRMVKTETTNLTGGTLPPWLTVTDGSTSASPRAAGGVRLTGATIRVEGFEIDLAGCQRVRLDLHHTPGVLPGEGMRFGLAGAGGGAAADTEPGASEFNLAALDADGGLVAPADTDVNNGSQPNTSGPDKRYHLTFWLDCADRTLYLGEGDQIWARATYSPTQLPLGPVRPVLTYSADGPVDKDVHQVTVETHWL